METAMVVLVAAMGLSFIGTAVAIFFDKSRLIAFFYLVCMALGGATLVLMVLILIDWLIFS